MVGAWHDDDEKGSAYLFREPTSGGWNDAIQTAKLTASDRADHDQFGRSVSVEGDTVVVGAFYDDDDGEGSGSAYVFKEPNSGWAAATETAKLTASDGAAFDFFGISIAVDGDTVVVLSLIHISEPTRPY